LETVHHLYVAHLKHYLTLEVYDGFRDRYTECVRMLNGLERALERQLTPGDRHWPGSSPPEP
jgi:hypothetical protein